MTDIDQLFTDFKSWMDNQSGEIWQRAQPIYCGLHSYRNGSLSPDTKKALARNVFALERIVRGTA